MFRSRIPANGSRCAARAGAASVIRRRTRALADGLSLYGIVAPERM